MENSGQKYFPPTALITIYLWVFLENHSRVLFLLTSGFGIWKKTGVWCFKRQNIIVRFLDLWLIALLKLLGVWWHAMFNIHFSALTYLVMFVYWNVFLQLDFASMFERDILKAIWKSWLQRYIIKAIILKVTISTASVMAQACKSFIFLLQIFFFEKIEHHLYRMHFNTLCFV